LAYEQLQLLPLSAFGRLQPSLWIRLRQVFKFVTARYVSALPVGTKIRRFAWVLSSTFQTNEGGIFLPRKVILVKPVQPRNASLPMLKTFSGMVILVKPVQPENALLPILKTLLGMVTLVKPVQPENAPLPMIKTLLDMEICVNPVQLKNALLGILVPPFIVTLLSDAGT
jgi:hypothetical protein